MRMDELRLVLWREKSAVLGIGVLILVIILVPFLRNSGPVTTEMGTIVGFESRPDIYGDYPIVVVKLGNGLTEQVRTTSVLLNGCAKGRAIALTRRAHSVQVASRACEQ